MTNFMDPIPMLVVYLLIVFIAIAAAEIGFQAARFWQHRTNHTQNTMPSGVVGATLGLLAFMLAFTTGLALTRFDYRRSLVRDEANAIGTTFLRAGYLAEPVSTDSRALLREYVDVRLDAVVPGQFTAAVKRSEEIQAELWTMAETQARANMDSPLIAIYIESLNEMIDIHSLRLLAAEVSRLPTSLWGEIFVMTSLVMFLVGVSNGFDGSRNLLAVTILALVFGAVILIIVDLDRPQGGFLKISQQALIDLQNQLKSSIP